MMQETQNQGSDIILTEADERAFRDQLKQGIYKELYRREFLTKTQLNQLLKIA